MSTSDILSEDMTLEQKLEAIANAMQSVEVENVRRVDAGLAPIDPASATICDGCE